MRKESKQITAKNKQNTKEGSEREKEEQNCYKTYKKQ